MIHMKPVSSGHQHGAARNAHRAAVRAKAVVVAKAESVRDEPVEIGSLNVSVAAGVCLYAVVQARINKS